MKKIIWFEIYYPLKDYVATLNRQEAIFDYILPAVISFLINRYVFTGCDVSVSGLAGSIVSMMAILVGFSITCIVILSTGSSANIDEVKKLDTERRINNVPIKLHQLLLSNFTYCIIVELVALFINLIASVKCGPADLCKESRYLLYINIYLISHIILLNIRNITNFYFILWKSKP